MKLSPHPSQREVAGLLTNDAKAFFAKRGYAEVQRSVAPPEIQAPSQFGSSCRSAAALMRKELEA